MNHIAIFILTFLLVLDLHSKQQFSESVDTINIVNTMSLENIIYQFIIDNDFFIKVKDSIKFNEFLKEHLNEMTILKATPYLTYQFMKYGNIKFEHVKEINNANRNMNLICKQIREGCLVANDNYSNYRQFVKSQAPKDFEIILFSSNPNVGLIPAFVEILKLFKEK